MEYNYNQIRDEVLQKINSQQNANQITNERWLNYDKDTEALVQPEIEFIANNEEYKNIMDAYNKLVQKELFVMMRDKIDTLYGLQVSNKVIDTFQKARAEYRTVNAKQIKIAQEENEKLKSELSANNKLMQDMLAKLDELEKNQVKKPVEIVRG